MMGTMGSTSITVDQDTAMELRQIKNDMSRAAGRVVPLPAVIMTLIACWRERQPRDHVAAVMAMTDRELSRGRHG